MKIICNKNDLLKGVNIALKAVPVRTTMSILECILIDAAEGEIKLIANDMELGIETKIDGKIIESGRIAINAKFFAEYVRKLPDNEVTVETDDKYNVTIICESTVLKKPGRSGEDFSYLPFIEKESSITVSQFTLKEIIRQTIFSIGDNESNKIMTGELFEVKDNILKVVSLDRYRVSIRNVELSSSYNPISVIVPGKTLGEISKILSGETDKEVDVFFSTNHIVFEFENTVVVSRLIDGEYFKINQMLSKEHNTKITVNTRELVNCLDRAMLLIRDGNKKPVILDIKNGRMNINIVCMEDFNQDIEVEKEGQDIKIGFDPKFLIDALRVIDDENVSLYFMNSKAPCTIKDDDSSYIYLILPVNY